MSANAVVSTIYSGSRTVVVDTGSTPISAPWLARTTYFLNRWGRTTAVLAQTDQPTASVTLNPVPYTTHTHTPLPSPIASVLPSGWMYQGCYDDASPVWRVLGLKQPDDPSLTVQSCVWSCHQLGYSISGLEFRNQCYCSNALYYGSALSQSDFDCNMTCNGNVTEICGGINRLSVYSNGTLTTYSPAPTSKPTMAAPTTASSSTTPTLRHQVPAATIAAIGAVTGLSILIALICYLRWRIKRDRLRPKNQLQSSRITPQMWPSSYGVPFWENIAKETEKYNAGFRKSTMTPVEGNGSGLGLQIMQIGDRRSIAELRERYERLLERNQQSSDTGWGSSDTYTASSARHIPPRIATARAPPELPTSILKRPLPTVTTATSKSKTENEDEQGSRAVPAPGFPALVKKGVRFGVNQIREFGMSPLVGHESESSST